MAAIDYPSTLPDFKAGKTRQQVQTYRTSQPFAGPMYIEGVTDQSPVTWDVTIDCVGQIQARQFQAFLRKVCNGEPFNKCILTEEGHVEHEVRFISMPLSPTQIGNFTWQYSGTIYGVKLIQEDAFICDEDLIICWLQDAACIDVVMNSVWPEA